MLSENQTFSFEALKHTICPLRKERTFSSLACYHGALLGDLPCLGAIEQQYVHRRTVRLKLILCAQTPEWPLKEAPGGFAPHKTHL